MNDTDDFCHVSFEGLHIRFTDYIEIEFKLQTIQIQRKKNPQKFNESTNQLTPGKEETR